MVRGTDTLIDTKDQLAACVLLDSGANMPVCPRVVSTLLRLPIYKWNVSKKVEFGNGTIFIFGTCARRYGYH
jgi:hypothetical protein